MNILILGIMGAGKTTIGKNLAKEIKYDFCEVDQLVIESAGFHDINEVYEAKSSLWKENELRVMKELSLHKDQVIACSGGIIENDLNLLYFRENSHQTVVIYLKARPEVLVKRLLTAHDAVTMENSKKVRDNIDALFKKRDSSYREYADFVIDTDEKMPADIIVEIIDTLKIS